MYHLAGVRLRDLCVKLDISDSLRKKIWTCFEFSIVQCPELMTDRHLDQLLMCAIYVMAKVSTRGVKKMPPPHSRSVCNSLAETRVPAHVTRSHRLGRLGASELCTAVTAVAVKPHFPLFDSIALLSILHLMNYCHLPAIREHLCTGFCTDVSTEAWVWGGLPGHRVALCWPLRAARPCQWSLHRLHSHQLGMGVPAALCSRRHVIIRLCFLNTRGGIHVTEQAIFK